MGYADGYYYGQGRIICDTSTFSVGDTIRVRSMTDSNKVWNKQVATVGTPLVFTVPCYDYYKICTVQDIGGVATEIGGVYKTIDYGQTLFINVLDKTTLGGIQGILNAHQESSLLAIGDEVTITQNGADWIMQIGEIDSTNHKIKFVSKYLISTNKFNNANVQNTPFSSSDIAKPTCESFYNAIADKDKQYIKLATRENGRYNLGWVTYNAYCWLPSCIEVFGTNQSYGSPTVAQSQMPIFTTQADRIKTYNGTASGWWTSDNITNGSYNIGVTSSTGGFATGQQMGATTHGFLPCFELQADS